MKKGSTSEHLRMMDASHEHVPKWHLWGPYVSERSWGTVREDYSQDGEAWNYFPHDLARSKAYRWSEDGIAGVSDRYQIMALSFAFWNGKDPILKERLYGVNGSEGNHGEDVKEVYFYEDNLPSHAYMRYRYFYPVDEFPYQKILEANQGRAKSEQEFEIEDTEEFLKKRFFEISIETMKINHQDLAFCLTCTNHCEEEKELSLLPQITLRNTWSWDPNEKHLQMQYDEEHGAIYFEQPQNMRIPFINFYYSIGKRYFYSKESSEVIFTDNNTNNQKIYQQPNETPYVKDGFHDYVIFQKETINKKKVGSKSAHLIRSQKFLPHETKTFWFRFSDQPLRNPFNGLEEIKKERLKDVEEFYDSIQEKKLSEEERKIQRAAWSSLIWSKQFYHYNVQAWITGDKGKNLPPPQRSLKRNIHWRHLVSKRILLMPDKWEYPWFAAWDLAFHAIAYAYLDIQFAKEQLWLLMFDQFQHPNGQIPAYEWEFSELNPPVQAWACYTIYQLEEKLTGKKDLNFLKRCFHKMMINFVWWVNRVDSQGNNIFEGGFLGLDNITIFDRNRLDPSIGSIEQSDGTGWVGFFCLKLMRIALELAKEDKEYASLAVKFFEHFVYIGSAIHAGKAKEVGLWNDQDGFFYDILLLKSGERLPIMVRSLVGIIPLFAVDFISEEDLNSSSVFKDCFEWFMEYRKDLMENCFMEVKQDGKKGFILALMNFDQARRVISKIVDPEEFFSEYGLRSLSKVHEKNPFSFGGTQVKYEPGETEHFMKGGNSNWRGPVWMPMNYLIIETFSQFEQIFGKNFKFQLDNGEKISFEEAKQKFIEASSKPFKMGKNSRPIFCNKPLFKKGEIFSDYIWFYEHFHAETGRGLGASHQTGWTALIGNILQEKFTE
jgi:hypothetical protein